MKKKALIIFFSVFTAFVAAAPDVHAQRRMKKVQSYSDVLRDTNPQIMKRRSGKIEGNEVKKPAKGTDAPLPGVEADTWDPEYSPLPEEAKEEPTPKWL